MSLLLQMFDQQRTRRKFLQVDFLQLPCSNHTNAPAAMECTSAAVELAASIPLSPSLPTLLLLLLLLVGVQ